MKNFSYKDIARLAHVSISTVSRFYNGGYVSKQTKSRIQDIVTKYNYYPNHGARLIRGSDNSVFIIMPEQSPNYYQSVVLGISQQAKVFNVKTLTYLCRSWFGKVHWNSEICFILKAMSCDFLFT
nr:LacI family DNA-binding transcriptional regulator [Mycoplasmopsis bovis]